MLLLVFQEGFIITSEYTIPCLYHKTHLNIFNHVIFYIFTILIQKWEIGENFKPLKITINLK
jgi:hypothetical protein